MIPTSRRNLPLSPFKVNLGVGNLPAECADDGSPVTEAPLLSADETESRLLFETASLLGNPLTVL